MKNDSLRKKLFSDSKFAILSTEEYLERLHIVADPNSPLIERRIAKEELLNAHMRLIAKTIRKLLPSTGEQGGYDLQSGIGIESPSEIVVSMAGHVFEQLTEMAKLAEANGFRLSTAITDRVTKRVIGKYRKASAQKRKAEFDSPDSLTEEGYHSDPSNVLEALLIDESYRELKETSELLSGNQGLVLQAVIYGFETEQDINIAAVARNLGISPTTARSAYETAKKKLSERFPELADRYSGKPDKSFG